MPSKPESPAPEEDQEFEEEEEEVEEEEEEEEEEEVDEEEEEPEEVEEEEEEVDEEEEEPEEVEEEEPEEVDEEEEEEEEEVEEENDEEEEVEEEEDEEEKVEMEEEEEEEMEEEEEEELEEEENDGEKSADLALDSPSAVKEDDSEQEVESEDDGEESEKTETGDLTTEAHDTAVGHSDPVNLSNEFLSAQVRDVSHETDEDIKPQILSNEDVATEDKGPQECLAESTVSGDQKVNIITPTGAGVGKSNSSCIIEKEVAVGSPVRDEKVSNALIKEEAKQMDMQVGEDIKVKASSSLTPQIRPRSSSPGAEFEDGNKRPAIVCDFFARGWCIKGSSCKFLHQKDGVTSKSDKQDAVATSIDNLGPEQRFLSSGSLAQSSGYGNTNPIPYDKYGSYTSTGFFSSPNLNTSVPSQGIPALRETYTWAGSGASQRSFDGDHGGYYSSKSSLLGHSSSPFYSRHDPESFSLPLHSWEPSVPFRPSFNFSSFISSPRNQYDPLLDSIDRPSGEDRSFQEFSVAQGVVTHNISHQPVKGDSVLFHQQPQYGALRPSAEAVRAFVPKEENPPKPSNIANTSNTMEVDHRNLGLQADGNKPNKESKALKHFRASLVEFVKELVKPHWRDGHLSKDAHNTVVKKAVEKVLSAFQPHQIPNTAESTTHYLSSCRPKLTRLVEGYVGKYANA